MPLGYLERGKASGSTSLSLTEPVAAPFLEALCRVLCQCSAFGARTGRALQDCFALGRRRSNCFAIRCRAGAQAARPLASMKPQAAQPMVKRARPRLYYHWYPIGVAFGLCAGSFAVRAPCAHQRLGNASHKAKRFQKRRGGGVVGERIAIITPLSTPKAKQLLLKGTRGAQAFHKPLATGAERERPSASRMPFPHQRKSNAAHKAKRFQSNPFLRREGRRCANGCDPGTAATGKMPVVPVGGASGGRALPC